MSPKPRRARSVPVAAWVTLLMMLLTGCPHEADDSREVRFSIVVGYDDTFPRDPDVQSLTIGPADVEKLGVEDPVSFDDFGSFVISTSTIAEGDARFTYCTEEPIVVADVDTGQVAHTIPAGTCLTEGSPLELG